MSNNTATPLISHGTFTGAYQKASATSAVIQVNVFSDTSGILHIQQSANGFFTQNDTSFVYDTVGTAKIFETPLALANYRITYTNTSGRTQSYLYIQTIDRTIPATDIDIRFLSGQTDSALMFAFDPQTGVKVPLHCDSSGNLGISANVSVSLDHTSDSVAVWGAEANGTQQILLTDASGRLLVVTDSGPGDVTNISGQVDVMNFPPPVTDVSATIVNWIDASGLHVYVNDPITSVTADISGQTVLVGNFPAPVTDVSATIVNWIDASGLHVYVNDPVTSVTADISGQTVLVGNFPAPVTDVSATIVNWIDASGLHVYVNDPITSVTADISGQTVLVGNFPAPVTDVSATIVNWIDASGLHVYVNDPITSVTADISGQTVLVGNYPATQVVSGDVSVSNFPALQEISGNVAVMNLLDLSGLHVVVENPITSVTADISGQTVLVGNYPATQVVSGDVSISNFPLVQDITGQVAVTNLLDLSGLYVVVQNPVTSVTADISGQTVLIGNFPATQVVSGDVSISNFPALQEISGNVAVMNLLDLSGIHVVVENPITSVTADISGQTVLIGNFPATQVVSGDVSISNFPALQEISGNVAVMNLLDLSGIHVVVENPITSVTADISGQTVLVGNFPATQVVSGTVSVDNFPALQEISGNVAVMNLLDLSGIHVVVENPITSVSADISGQTVLVGNFPAVQDISGSVITSATNSSMAMYASGFEPVTLLVGEIAYITGLDVSGSGTTFSADVAPGDNFWIVVDAIPQLWGVVDTVSTNTLLTLVSSYSNISINNDTIFRYAVNVVEANKPLLLDSFGDLRVNVVNKLLSVEVSNEVTEVNSADILTEVTSINGKITTCNTSDISGTVFISNLPAPATDISATILNFPSVQDISGTVITSATSSSMTMYASGYEPNNYLSGVAKITNTDVSGIATQFLSQVAEGDNFWIINIFETPVFIGVVASIQSNTQLTLVASAGLTYSYDYYRIVLNLVEGNVPLQLTPVGGNLRTYVSGGFVTESNSDDILTEVTSINGKITACNTSDISGSVNLYALKPTPTYTQLAGEFLLQPTSFFCDGSGTAFLSELAEGDFVYYVPNIGEPAVLLGTVLSVAEDVGMYLTNVQISVPENILIENYGLTVTTIAPTALVTHTGTDFLSVQVENTITEVNSAAILADVSGINGKITACNTSDISGSVNLYAEETIYTYPYTQLAGTLTAYDGGTYALVGSGTTFQTDFVVGDVVYFVEVSGNPAIPLGTVTLITSQTAMTVTATYIFEDPTLAVSNYGKLVATSAQAPVKLVTHLETQWLSVAVENVLSSSIKTLFDVSAGTSLTISSSPITLQSWSPTNLGNNSHFAYYKFYNKVGATFSDTPLFTYPIHNNNTIAPIPLYNLKFTTACSVRATHDFTANDTTIPNGIQISNFLYSSL